MDREQKTEPVELTTLSPWVELTTAYEGEPVLVNLDRITAIEGVSEHSRVEHPNAYTVLWGESGTIHVREPFVVVAALVRGEAGNA